MPRAATANASQLTEASSSLKRHQACHRCRRRKMKCDAQRPCSNCHHAVDHSRGPPPECTYDDPWDIPQPVREPRQKYLRMENRIAELEGLLAEAQDQLARLSLQQQPAQPFPPPPPPPASQDFTLPADSLGILQSFAEAAEWGLRQPTTPSDEPTSQSAAQSTNVSANLADTLNQTAALWNARDASEFPEPDPFQSLFWPPWPSRLPPPDSLHHLVDVFFNTHTHARRMFHRARFMASLALQVDDPGFPSLAVLHAMCAVASIRTTGSAPIPKEAPALQLFGGSEPPKTFGEFQMSYAREAQELALKNGTSMFETLQSSILSNYWLHSQAKWAVVWRGSGETLRLCTPLGLNLNPNFVPLHPWRIPYLMGPPRDSIEAEMHRQTFWLAYAFERWHGITMAWASSMDDEDIHQYLPITLTDFENGADVPLSERQTMTTANMLSTHHPKLTDSFTLYIKASILLSKVKTFNTRVDATPLYSLTPTNSKLSGPNYDYIARGMDPRHTLQFKQLDNLINTFQTNFPRDMRDPIKNGTIDSNLYSAMVAPYIAGILLHDPHADPQTVDDIHAEKSLVAARKILELIYLACTSRFDITLLDDVVTFGWYLAARVFLRFQKSKVEIKEFEAAATHKNELEFAKLALKSMGERITLAARYAKMLDELTAVPIGPQLDETANITPDRMAPFIGAA